MSFASATNTGDNDSDQGLSTHRQTSHEPQNLHRDQVVDGQLPRHSSQGPAAAASAGAGVALPSPPPSALHKSRSSVHNVLMGNYDSSGRERSSISSPVGKRPQLMRAKSDLCPANNHKGNTALNEENIEGRGSRLPSMEPSLTPDDEEGFKLLHGLHEHQTSADYLEELNSNFYMYFTEKRHKTVGLPREPEGAWKKQDWRMRDRLKTVSAALAICLNIGVDPPDVISPNPCAKLECWIDTTAAQNKLMECIGKRLQEQYETLSLRTRYKQYLDPSVDETKKFCISLRRNAKDERVLFHYNGHGVPLPTPSGELWVFNKNYTQYIPVSLYDLQTWLGGPSLFVFDVSHGGNIVHNFHLFVEKHEKENAEIRKRDPHAVLQNYGDCILLAACEKNETLPSNPELPADLFTCCLTTPIDIALLYFVLQNPLRSNATPDNFHVPGRLQDRRSPLGELNWIFTAITDTIAWNTLPRPLFKKLFRQDLMVAALFRNFLLAERIMRAHNCHPISSPKLPETHNHPLWQSWDLAVETVLAQLPALRDAEKGLRKYEYQSSSFFAQQLTAFQVYLESNPSEDNPPDQLPIVLQVLLSQAHRLRALVQLSKFLDLGPWAVHLALNIGIFPYVVKLLQSAAQELKPVMVFIWARIMAVDHTVQMDLLKDNGIHYFISILSPQSPIPVQNDTEHRAMCAFIIAIFCRGYPQGQTVCLSPELFDACLTHMNDKEEPLLRQWSSLCLSTLWLDFPEAKWVGIRCSAPARLCARLAVDKVPEVRAAIIHALTTFLGIPDLTDEVAQIEEEIAIAVLPVGSDGSVIVRRELLVFLSTFVKRYLTKFIVAAYEHMLEERYMLRYRVRYPDAPDAVIASSGFPGVPSAAEQATAAAAALGSSPPSTFGTSPPAFPPLAIEQSVSANTTFGTIWKLLLILSADPHPMIAQDGSTIVDYVHRALFVDSPLGGLAYAVREELIQLESRYQRIRSDRGDGDGRKTRTQDASGDSGVGGGALGIDSVNAPGSQTSGLQRSESYLQLSLRRTASMAASLKNLAFGASNKQPAGPPESEASLQRKPSNASSNVASSPTTARGSAPRNRIPLEWTRPPGVNDRIGNSSSDGYYLSKNPLCPGFEPRDLRVAPRLPLQSTFLDWAMEYFREPQMKPPEPEEPGSSDWNERIWRQGRNEKIMIDTQPLKEKSSLRKWDTYPSLMNTSGQPMKLSFHQFEDHLAVADDKDNICIWDWAQNTRLSKFSNGNPVGSKISNLRFINEDDQALLMTGSSDGVLKIFRNYDSDSRAEIVSAFRVLPELIPSNKNAGLVFDWMQVHGKAFVAGDIKVIRVWNAATEVCESEIPARSGSCITSLTAEQVAGSYIVAGFGDGAVRVFDPRIRPTSALVKVWREHKQWITNVHMQRGGIRELVSASRNGEVKLWDIRNNKSISTIQTTRHTLRSLSVHEHLPVFSVGTSRHEVLTFSTDGSLLSTFEPHTGFLQQSKTSPIVSTAFHPHRTMFACSALNSQQINLVYC